MKPIIDKTHLQKIVIEHNENGKVHVQRYGDMTIDENTAFLAVHIADEIHRLLDEGWNKQDAYNFIDTIVSTTKCAIDLGKAWEDEENEGND